MRGSIRRFFPLFCTIAMILIIFTGCEFDGDGLTRYEAYCYDLFDTDTSFTAYCESEDEFNSVWQEIYSELLRLDEIFDYYGEGELAELNSEGFIESPSEDLVSVLETGIEFYSLSGGKLNIAMGSVLSLWHSARETGVLPDENVLFEASEHTDISCLSVSDDYISLSVSYMSIDLGSLAKGYAADRAAEIAVESGIESFAIDLGGNILTGEKKPTGDWTIGIKDPSGGIFTAVNVSNLSVVTSGDYERYLEIDGEIYSHIIDPETLYPASLYRSVTVICDSSLTADALSTSLFCMELADGMKLCEETGAQALWIFADGNSAETEGFKAYE